MSHNDKKLKDMNTNLVWDTLLRLECYIRDSEYFGFDPYDIKGSPIYMWALAIPRYPFLRKIQRKLVLSILILGESYFPKVFRSIFKIRPTRNAKGVSLIIKGYLNLYKVTKNEGWKTKAITLLDWMLDNQSHGYSYCCWGYPFNWYSGGGSVPAFTPAAVVCAAAFDAFWMAWLVTREEKYLNVCISICNFFIKHLNISNIDDTTVCFSYTPLDKLHVHNINLLVADCLLRVGIEIGERSFITMGKKAVNFALVEQNPDGSIFYYGRADNYIDSKRIDHYHSGFEMRSLYSIWKSSGDEVYKKSLDRYYAFYQMYLINEGCNGAFPLMYPGLMYPINIHSCAEAILLNATLSKDYKLAEILLGRLIDSIIKRMFVKTGWFKYMIRKFGPFELHTNIPYMRWGQAWMFLALTQALLVDD